MSEVFVPELGFKLGPHALAIWEGRSKLPPESVEKFRAAWRAKAAKPKPAPTVPGGPGTELADLIETVLGLGGVKGCGGCADMVAWMNKLGVEGCRLPENASTIMTRLRDRSKKVGWPAKLKAGVKAVAAGIILDPFDPAEGLLKEAIRRAEAKATTRSD